jgi:uncharacterized membrane protein
MTTLLVIALVVVVLGIIATLRRHRTAAAPWIQSVPIGADPERDRDLGRAGADLAAIAAHRLDIRPS